METIKYYCIQIIEILSYPFHFQIFFLMSIILLFTSIEKYILKIDLFGGRIR